MKRSCTAFAPATVANLGPGFDVLGLAVEGAGDTVTVTQADDRRIQIRRISGDDGRLPLNPQANTAAIAARATLKRAGVEMGLLIDIDKGLPIGSGLGSSAASAAAAAVATNGLIGSPLRPMELIEPCLEAEAVVSGRHADNIAPALLGGLILVRSLSPIDVMRIPTDDSLHVAVVTPLISVETKAARAVLPKQVDMTQAVQNSANLAAMVMALHTRDLSLLSRATVDIFSTPARSHLMPGANAAVKHALDAGALGAAMSGAGPSFFALCSAAEVARRCMNAMGAAFQNAGCETRQLISPFNAPGARIL
ncbi:MAG: homoserine kinase [Bradymonadia bacterium]